MSEELEQQLQRVYLSDAIDQVLANPTSPHVWHFLAPRFFHCCTQLQKQILDLFEANLPADGVAGFLRASFCASLLDEDQYYAQAGKILSTLKPQHLDRLNAFLVYVWAKLLARSRNTTEFISALNRANAPTLIAQMGQMVKQSATTALPKRNITEIKKIALLAPQMGTIHHAPTRLLLDHAALLLDAGVEVQVFCCQEMRIAHMAQLLGNGEAMPLAEGDAEQWAQLLSAPLQIHLGNPNLGLLRRFANILEPIAAFDPDLVLMVGMYSPLLATLYAQRPVVALNVHAALPMADCDVWLCNDKTLLQAEGVATEFAVGAAHDYPYRIRLRAQTPLHRAELGLPEDALVLVCVGYRLQHEINGEWAQALQAFLLNHPEAILLLVGTEEIPTALQYVAEEQIHTLPHQEVIGSILDCCDIYLNPARVGGGFSVLEAMASGMSVLALAGADGGNKLAEYAQADLTTYFAELENLSRDPQQRLQMGNALRAKFFAEYDLNQAGPSLLAACEQARLHFLARQT